MLALALVNLSTPPETGSPGPVDPFDEGQLAATVWQLAPDVLAARRDLVDAEAVRDRTLLYPNPGLTATWGTIPLGQRTGDPTPGFWDVPNYTIGLTELVELGKRGPRQRAAAAARAATELGVTAAGLRTFFAVLESLSDQAAATARLAVLERLVTDSKESLRLQSARADKGDIAPLEVDRLEVEHSRLLSSARDAEAARDGALIACGALLGATCPRFADEASALRFLRAHPETSAPDDATAIDGRPDLMALRAERAQLEAELTLANRQVIPDPVAGIGFTHDQFIAAGNQSNSLSLSLTFPFPVFDRGQTEANRARRRLAINETTARSLRATVLRGIADQRRQLEVLGARARILDEQAVPRARSVVERTEAAFRRGGVAFPDVLLARRAFEELELDRIEVATALHRAGLALRRARAALPWPVPPPRLAQAAPAPAASPRSPER